MAAAASPEDAPSAELQAAVDDRSATIIRYANYVILIVFIYLMVFKPGA
jgi:hypothetical protein